MFFLSWVCFFPGLFTIDLDYVWPQFLVVHQSRCTMWPSSGHLEYSSTTHIDAYVQAVQVASRWEFSSVLWVCLVAAWHQRENVSTTCWWPSPRLPSHRTLLLVNRHTGILFPPCVLKPWSSHLEVIGSRQVQSENPLRPFPAVILQIAGVKSLFQMSHHGETSPNRTHLRNRSI